MKKKKSRKKLVIGVVAVAVAAGGVKIYTGMNQGEKTLPQVEVVAASRGDVQQTVEASGTVASEEEKTYFSPVNAKVDSVDFKEGDIVKAGTKLVEFDQKDLKREEKKADLNLKSGELDMKNTVNKSDEAVRKQQDAKGNAASLKAQISQANANAQAQAAAEAARQQQAAQKAKEAQQKAIQKAYNDAVSKYQKETLPAYQNQLNQLSSAANQAQTAYNQAETAYQMAFQTWSADQSDENAEALSEADQVRNDAQIAYQAAKAAYDDYKSQKPETPVMSDYTDSSVDASSDLLSDGTGVSTADQNATDTSTVTGDTTVLESKLEQASNDLAELQSELSTQQATAEADPGAVTKEEKEKMEITNNLAELDQMSAKELVDAAKKGISADFNGVITKVSVVEGSTTAMGTELFTLQNTDKVDITVNISKYDYDKVQEGQSADITLAGKTYEGKVTKVSHIATQNEKGASLIAADIRIMNPDEDVFIGVDAKVTIHAEEADNVVILPSEVVNIGKTGSFCYVLDNGVITKKDITTGISSDDYVEITEGLSEGDQVIRDLGTLEEGMQAEAVAGQDGTDGSIVSESSETVPAEEGA